MLGNTIDNSDYHHEGDRYYFAEFVIDTMQVPQDFFLTDLKRTDFITQDNMNAKYYQLKRAYCGINMPWFKQHPEYLGSPPKVLNTENGVTDEMVLIGCIQTKIKEIQLFIVSDNEQQELISKAQQCKTLEELNKIQIQHGNI